MITKLSLYHFRNFKTYSLDITKPNVVLFGKNGAGKSNILEAISLFSIGRGLKKAMPQEIIQIIDNEADKEGWSAEIQINNDLSLRTSYKPQGDGSFKKISTAQNTPVKAHTSFTEWVNILWITPETDRLFLDTPSTRRKFVDRFVYAQDVHHLKRVTRYEEAVRERLKILKTHGLSEDEWLSALEKTIVEEGVDIAIARQKLLKQLSTFTPKGQEIGILPGFKAKMDGPFEELLSSKQEVEDAFLQKLRDNRFSDKEAGMTRFGPHRSDLFVWHPLKKIGVYHCSTGEQKILLLSLLIAFMEQFCLNAECLTVFLLDDVIAHLDEQHRSVLYNRLTSQIGAPFQAWFSGTEIEFFLPLKDHANFEEIV
jgi:DNA replication and repair protein RecF